MGTNFLIDTNIGIYLMNGSLNANGLSYIEPIINANYHLSVITKIELLGFEFKDLQDFIDTKNFVEDGIIIPLDDEIVEKTIEIRRIYKIKLPDALIAATALVFDLTLLSRNDKDFALISELKYINPFTV
jgi:predicted nucleic acid-binding protein